MKLKCFGKDRLLFSIVKFQSSVEFLASLLVYRSQRFNLRVLLPFLRLKSPLHHGWWRNQSWQIGPKIAPSRSVGRRCSVERVHSRSQNVISFNNKSTVLYIFYIKGKQKWALALFRRARISVRLTVDGRALVDVPLDGALPSEIRKMKLKFLLVLMAPIKKLIFIFIMSDLRTRPKLKSSIFNWTLFFSVIVGRRWRKRNFFTKKRGKNREPKFFVFFLLSKETKRRKLYTRFLWQPKNMSFMYPYRP